MLVGCLDFLEAIMKFIENLSGWARLNNAFLENLDEHFEFLNERELPLMVKYPVGVVQFA